MQSISVKFLKDKPQLVDVEASVQEVKQNLKKHNELQLVARQGQINRVGMIIKRVEEQTHCKIKSMKTTNEQQTIKDQKGQQKQIRVLYLKVVFVKN